MKIIIGLQIQKELKDKLDALAKKEGRTKTHILEQALQNYFKAKKIK